MAKAVAVEKGSRFSVRFHVDGLWCLSSLMGLERGPAWGTGRIQTPHFLCSKTWALTTLNSALHDKNVELQKKKFKLKTFVPPALRFQIY